MMDQYNNSSNYNNGAVPAQPAGNRKEAMYQQILNKLSMIRSQGTAGLHRQIKYINDKIDKNQYMYNFLVDNDLNNLRILIMILYDELEKQSILDSGSSISLKFKLEDMEKILQEKNQQISALNE